MDGKLNILDFYYGHFLIELPQAKKIGIRRPIIA